MSRVLLGRDAEVAAIEGALGDARPRAFAIVGEPGIGKTRLTTEIAERAAASGFTIAWGRAWEAGGAPPYWPWRLLLDALPGASADPVLAQVWGRRHASAIDPDQARFELFEGVAKAIRAAASAAPLLCILDDLHAADVPSLELAVFAARDLRAGRVTWLLTWRDAEAERAPVRDLIARLAREATLLPLARLSGADAERLIEDVRAETPVDVRAALIRATGGNPLFLIETLSCIAAGKPLDLERLPLAQGVGAVVRERLGPLSPEIRHALDAAAVVGRDVSLSRWAAAAELPIDVVRAHAAAVVGTGILDTPSGDRWRFCHELVRDAIERAMAADHRAAVHARIAHALDAEIRRGDRSLTGERAHHALAAGTLAPRLVVDWVIAGAEHARLQTAYEPALALLERATAQLGDDAALLVALGRARSDRGDASGATAAFQSAIEVARRTDDAPQLARAVLGLGAQFGHGSVRNDLVTLIDEVAPRLDSQARTLQARLLARKAAALTPSGEMGPILAMASDAIDLVAGSRDSEAELEVASSVSSIFSEFAHPRERLSIDERLVQLARKVGDRALELRGLTGIVIDHVKLGDLARAAQILDERDVLARAITLPRLSWHAPLLRSMLAMATGDFARCDAALAEVEAIARGLADPNVRQTIERHRVWLLLLAQRHDDLRVHEPRILEALRIVPPAMSVAVRALIRFRAGDHAAARAELARLDRSLPPAITMWATLAEVFAAVGTPEQQRHVYDQLAPHADTFAVWGLVGLTCGPPVAASLGLLAAALGERDRAATHFESALAAASSANATALVEWTHRWRDRAIGPAIASAPAPRVVAPTLRQHADVWTIEHAGRAFPVGDLRGMSMIAQLLARPDVEIHALELVSGGIEGEADSGDAGELLDKQARDAYRRRAGELADLIEDAESRGDVARAEAASDELEALQRELSRALGRGGRVRRAGVAAERARTTAQRRIREAIRRIAEADAGLGAHLENAIRTGTYCVYRSRPPS